MLLVLWAFLDVCAPVMPPDAHIIFGIYRDGTVVVTVIDKATASHNAADSCAVAFHRNIAGIITFRDETIAIVITDYPAYKTIR